MLIFLAKTFSFFFLLKVQLEKLLTGKKKHFVDVSKNDHTVKLVPLSVEGVLLFLDQ